MNTTGIILTLFTMLAWSSQIILTKYAATQLNANPVIFICISMMIASFGLISISGNSKFIIKSLRNSYSWAYAVSHILLNIATMFALIYISSSETIALQKFNVITGLMIGLIMFDKREVSKHDLIGCLLILIGVLITLSTINYNIVFQVIFIILSMAILSSFRTNIVERNSLMKQAKTFKQQAQILGMVLFITSFLLILVNLIFYKVGVTTNFEISLTKNQLIIALINGLIFIPVGMYGFFKSVKAINSENFVVLTAFLPVVTLVLEQLASIFKLIEIRPINHLNIISLAFIIIGALYITFKRKRS
jgi:drug/metabolite transporter (DMT)-like permease